MAEHRAEQIMAAAFAALSARPEFSTSRSPVDSLETFPAVSLFQGNEEPLGDSGFENIGFYDAAMTINLDGYVESTSPETAINAIRKAAHLALMADNKLGLSFVRKISPAGADEPELSNDGEANISMQRFSFVVEYRTSVKDPSE